MSNLGTKKYSPMTINIPKKICSFFSLELKNIGSKNIVIIGYVKTESMLIATLLHLSAKKYVTQ